MFSLLVPMIMNKEFWHVSGKPQKDKEEIERNLHHVSLEGLSFIDSLLRYEYKERPSSSQILQSPYMNKFEEVTANSPTLGEIIAKHGASFG